MAHPHRVRVTGLLESFAQGFAAELLWQGYRPKCVFRTNVTAGGFAPA
jgi:hypothetical protein